MYVLNRWQKYEFSFILTKDNTKNALRRVRFTINAVENILIFFHHSRPVDVFTSP